MSDCNAGEPLDVNWCSGPEYWNCCAVFANGTRLLSGGSEGTLTLWNLTDGTELSAVAHYDPYAPDDGHLNDVACVAVSADGSLAVTRSDDASYWHTTGTGTYYDAALLVWDLSGDTLVKRKALVGHTGRVDCCALFDNGTRLVSAGCDED